MRRPSDGFPKASLAERQGAFATNSARVLVIFAVIVLGSAAVVRILGHFCGAGCQ